MYKRITLVIICLCLTAICHLAYGNPIAVEIKRLVNDERPEAPTFPLVSLRLKGLGEDFLGIISDVESDILINPSLLPLLKSNSASVIFLPYYYTYYWNQNSVSASLLFPNTFITNLSFGIQNQLVYSSNGYHDIYTYRYDYNNVYYHNYDDFYYRQNDFLSYQQSIFLAFALSPTLRISPFWTFAISPYKAESEDEYQNVDIENNDTTYISREYSNSKFDDDYTYHQFGLATSYDLDNNLFQFVGSWKKGDDDIKSNSTGEDYWMYSSFYYWTYDSSYRYAYGLSRNISNDTAVANLSGNINAINLGLRWQKEIQSHQKFNTILDFNKSSFDLNGNEFDSSYSLRYDSSYERWRSYPDSETTSTEAVTSYARYTKSLALSGQGDVFNVRFGLGYESPLTKTLKGFIGVKSLLGTERDSIVRKGLEVSESVTYPIPVTIIRNEIIIPFQQQWFDTIIDTSQIFTYEVTQRKSLDVSLPLGLEYNVLPSLIIRGGITAKFSYEKSGLKDQWKEYPDVVNKGIDFFYSFGMGLKLGKRFSLDGYNAGNIFTVRDWIAQIRYTF
jgi:hypothetical protein